MNRYSLRSDSRVWWLPAGAAGLLAAGLLSVPMLPSAGLVPPDPSAPPAVVAPDTQHGDAPLAHHRCPPPPDPTYVGVPWASPRSHCATLRVWWRFVR